MSPMEPIVRPIMRERLKELAEAGFGGERGHEGDHPIHRARAVSSHHADLAAGRWHSMSLMEQLGNAGSEVSRALRARGQGHADRERSALHRFLDLMDMTIADPRLQGRRKEICRVREIVCDYFMGENLYASTPESLDRYFMAYANAARRKSGDTGKSRS